MAKIRIISTDDLAKRVEVNRTIKKIHISKIQKAIDVVSRLIEEDSEKKLLLKLKKQLEYGLEYETLVGFDF